MASVGKAALRVSCVGVLLGIMSARAGAAEEARAVPSAVTLPDALAYARAHQPQVRASLARVSATKAAAEIPRAQWEPRFGATAQLLVGTGNNTTAGYYNVSAL